MCIVIVAGLTGLVKKDRLFVVFIILGFIQLYFLLFSLVYLFSKQAPKPSTYSEINKKMQDTRQINPKAIFFCLWDAQQKLLPIQR